MTPRLFTQDDLSFATQPLDPKALKRLSETEEFFFRTAFYPLIDADLFLPMYSDNEEDSTKKKYYRPSTSPILLYMANYMRGHYGYSESEVVDRLHFDVRAQLAANIVGLGEKMPGLDRLLKPFQTRCENYAAKTGINPVFQSNYTIDLYSCALTGQDLSFLRSDSIQVSDHCARHSRDELVYMAIRMCVMEMAEKGSDSQKCWILHGGTLANKMCVNRMGRLAKYLSPEFTLNNFTYVWSAKTDEKRAMLCEDATELLAILDMDHTLDGNSVIDLGVRVINEQTRSNPNQRREFIPAGEGPRNNRLSNSPAGAGLKK